MSAFDDMLDDMERPEIKEEELQKAGVEQSAAAPQADAFSSMLDAAIPKAGVTQTEAMISPEGQPTPGSVDKPGVISPEDKAMFQSVGAVAGGLGPGGLEASRRFVHGLAKIPGGLTQAVLGAVDATWGPVTDPRGTKPRTDFENQFTKAFNETFEPSAKAKREIFADSLFLDGMELAGEIIPTMFIPISKLSSAVKLGAAEGVTQFQEDPTKASRLQSAAIGAGGGAIGHGLSRGIDFFTNLGGFMGRGLDDPAEALVKGKAVSEETGVPLLMSERLGSRSAAKVDALAATGSRGIELQRQFRNDQIEKLQKHFFKVADKADAAPQGQFFGDRVEKAYSNTVNKLTGVRSAQAKADFDAAIKQAGGIPVIKTDNLAAALDDVLAKFDGDTVNKLPKMKSFLNNVRTMRESITDVGTDARHMTIEEFQAVMATTGKSADGQAGIFSEIAGHDKYASRRINQALQDDLSSAAESGLPGADLLKVARDNYKLNSEAIDEIKSHALSKLFKRDKMPAPEEIEATFARMHPSQIRTAMKVLEDVDPGIHGGLQRFWLSEAMLRGSNAGAGAAVGEAAFEPKAVLKFLKNDPQFKAIFPNAKIRGQVESGIDVMRRMMVAGSSATGTLGPQLKEALGVAASWDITFLSRMVGGNVAPAALAKTLLTKEGVDSLRVIARPNTSPDVMANALLQLEKLMTGSNVITRNENDDVTR